MRLIGIDSVMCPKAERIAAWQALARDLDPALLDAMTTEIAADAVIETPPRFLNGEVRGRTVVPMSEGESL